MLMKEWRPLTGVAAKRDGSKGEGRGQANAQAQDAGRRRPRPKEKMHKTTVELTTARLDRRKAGISTLDYFLF
jgi:hypothetical protein